uniref:RING-type E3 ubiquitin transferase n=1 Tax=Solanum tuberosum TaxID=4113 RepID=M1BYW3_SOLTU
MDEVFDLDLALTVVEDFNAAAAYQLEEPSPISDDEDDEMMPMVNAVGFCSICMEEFEAEVGVKQVPCGHLFHSCCLTNWLSLRKSCPLCRFSFSTS